MLYFTSNFLIDKYLDENILKHRSNNTWWTKRMLHVYNLTSKELSTIHNSRGNSLLTLREWILHVIMYRRVFASKPLYVYHNFNPICVHNNICVHTLTIVYGQRTLIDFCRGKNTSHFSSSFSSKYIIKCVYFNKITHRLI